MRIILLLMLLLVTGCSLYDTKEDKQGRTIRVNKITGEIAIIDGDKLVKVKSEKEATQEKTRDDALATTKDWGSMSILNNIPVNLKTKWSDGTMSYQLEIMENLRSKGNYYSNLTIGITDSENFKIASIPLSLSKLTGLLGDDNKTIVRMHISDSTPLSKEDYKRITSYDVSWSGFNR